jgi:hypothetical protein
MEGAMSQKTYCLISGTLFLIIAVMHLLRLILGWEVSIAGWTAPAWISILGLIVPGLLSAAGFSVARRG